MTAADFQAKYGKGGGVHKSLGRMKAGAMNKTEQRYQQRLEQMMHEGLVKWFAFEPVNLRLGDKCFYSVDFLVLTKDNVLEAHEIKGGYIMDKGIVKLKVAAALFPFVFKMFQLVKGQWIEKEF